MIMFIYDACKNIDVSNSAFSYNDVLADGYERWTKNGKNFSSPILTVPRHSNKAFIGKELLSMLYRCHSKWMELCGEISDIGTQ